MDTFKFFQNKNCKYFPCHDNIEPEIFNCMFCYCPLYALGEECGGNFSYKNKKGVKDCTGCTVPHQKDNYDYMIEKTRLLIEIVRKPEYATDD
ncbi:MAG: cysteine-rich small domain-containing protein [Eubacteriaceae bacterium]|nr:cysteine-rich small domain-containing protein [Eubacteriaceae bacterium]